MSIHLIAQRRSDENAPVQRFVTKTADVLTPRRMEAATFGETDEARTFAQTTLAQRSDVEEVALVEDTGDYEIVLGVERRAS